MILTYHRVREPAPNDPKPVLCVSPRVFAEQLHCLHERDYRMINFAQLPQIDTGDKCAILTFDDGTEDNYRHALPILKEHRTTATIFVEG